MKKVKYSEPIPTDLVFYHKTEDDKHGIHVQMKMLEKSAILIYAFGKFQEKLQDWHWKSTKIKAKKKRNIFRESPVKISEGEIKGHILVNKKGNIIDMNFDPIILSIGIRLEELSNNKTSVVLKEKLKLIEDLPEVVKPIEYYQYGDNSVETRIRKFLKEKSIVNREIKIMDPYISSDLIKLLKDVIPGDLQIKILTCKLNKADEPQFTKEISVLPPGISLTIKKLIKEGSSANITDNPPSNPFHDRFILADQDLILIGTSFNSIIKNSTFITEMNGVSDANRIFDMWFLGKVIPYKKLRIKFEQVYP